MKRAGFTVGALLLATTAPAQLQVQQQAEAREDFQLGKTVAACLVVKCQIFSGYLTIDSKSGEPMLVRVQEWLFGDPIDLEVVPVSWEYVRGGIPTGVPLRAWSGARMVTNASVAVVVSQENGFGVSQGEVVLVATAERQMGIVRMLAAEASKLPPFPASVSQLAVALSEQPSPALAAYVYTYAVLSKSFRRELPAELLMGLIANPSVPSETWADVTRRLVADYHLLSWAARERVVRRLVELGQSADDAASIPAFRGLAEIASSDDLAIRTMISPSELTKLGNAYAALRKSGAVSRLPSLEAGLGDRNQ